MDRGNGRSRIADDVEREVASVRKKGRSGRVQTQAAAFCPSCGAKVKANDRFCAQCGQRIEATNTNDNG
jgi:predicted amidophosphoribosyltransferase